MGGEGVPWVGQAPFSHRPHMFANLGDGTYYHSGSLAIRQSIAAERQHHLQDPLQRRGRDDRRPADRWHASTVAADHPRARGRRRASASSWSPTSPGSSARTTALAPGVTVRHRDDLDTVQRELREVDWLHGHRVRPDLRHREAARRKRGTMPDPPGGSSSTSWCAKAAAIAPCRATACAWSRSRPSSAASAASTRIRATRTISCVKGFCPSFVTVEGGQLKKPKKEVRDPKAALPPIAGA